MFSEIYVFFRQIQSAASTINTTTPTPPLASLLPSAFQNHQRCSYRRQGLVVLSQGGQGGGDAVATATSGQAGLEGEGAALATKGALDGLQQTAALGLDARKQLQVALVQVLVQRLQQRGPRPFLVPEREREE